MYSETHMHMHTHKAQMYLCAYINTEIHIYTGTCLHLHKDRKAYTNV